MNCIVIGGAGFIGSHLCSELLKKENYVICADNFSLGNENNINNLTKNSRFTVVKADASEMDELDAVFEKYRPDFVFHLAANSDIRASSNSPSVEYKNTYTTTFCILMLMKKYNIKRLFFSSTSAVYGDKRDIRLDENTSGLSPISYYGAAKLGSEALISAFSYMNDMKCLVFRFPNVIGGHLTHGVIYDFVNKLYANNSKLQILGDGRQTKPYIHVSDLINAIMMFNDLPTGISLYNVSPIGATSVTRIAEIICEEMGLNNVIFEYTGGEIGWKGDVPRFEYCSKKINDFGWCAQYTSDEAVRLSVKETLLERFCL